MIQIKQLFRKPFKTLWGVLLILMATAMLCVSLSQFISFVWTRESVEAQYATIALPTNKYKIATTEGEDGRTTVSYYDSQPPQVMQFLSSLSTQLPNEIHSEERHNLITGFCSKMNPLNWAECYNESAFTGNADGTTVISEYPYTCAMIVFKATEISAPYRFGFSDIPLEGIFDNLSELPELAISNEGFAVDITGTVENAYLLHEGFDDPTGYTIRLTVRCETEDMLAELDLREGERYLAYGMDYFDLNRAFRQSIGMLGDGAYERFSTDNIRMLTQEEIDSLPQNDPAEMEKHGWTEKSIAIYSEPDAEKATYLTQSELDQIASCSLTVQCSPCLLAFSTGGEIQRFDVNTGSFYTITTKEFNSMYARAGIAHITGSVEEFLAQEENELWRETANVIQINNHAFPVIATDNLMSIAPFGLQEAFLADGRAFSKNEYIDGSAVCLISETLAVQSGLNIGDSIAIKFYETDEYFPGAIPSSKSANPEAAFFSTYKGFSSDEIEFEIVGLYRQKQEWSDGPYAFTPNTIFVPKASAVGQPTAGDSGIFYSLLLKNGAQEKVEEYLAENGYAGLLAYYDQGYSNISDNLTKFFSTSIKILLVGVVGWLVFLIVFLFMFPAQQKTEAERLWTLGAPKSLIVRNYVLSGSGIALPGIVLGGGLSFVFVQTILQKLSEQAGITLDTAKAPVLIFGLLLLQFVVIICLVFLIARNAIRRLYK
ncbi:MAG: ABC transporter permease [Clostridia bacterium]|nr:ABC transporter permease [Clostridia bacterium]